MKFLSSILLLAAVAASATAQITMTSTASSQQGTAETVYDSSYNFIPERDAALKGQTVYFIPNSEGYSSPAKHVYGFYAPSPESHRHHKESGNEQKDDKKKEEHEKHKGNGLGNVIKHAPIISNAASMVNNTHGNSSGSSSSTSYAEPAPANDKNVYKGELVKGGG